MAQNRENCYIVVFAHHKDIHQLTSCDSYLGSHISFFLFANKFWTCLKFPADSLGQIHAHNSAVRKTEGHCVFFKDEGG